MDKYEYNLKLNEIERLVRNRNYEEAVKIADTIDWRRVRNTRTLCMISEVYEANNRLKDCKEILLRAYKHSQMTRTVLFRLVEVTIKMKEFDEAAEYYNKFVTVAPDDTSHYILKYKIYRGRGAALKDRIAILEEYKKIEFTAPWTYELAMLYCEAGERGKCIECCDDLVLWFRQGEYVIKALELKKSLTELTPVQSFIYEHRGENRMPIQEQVEVPVLEQKEKEISELQRLDNIICELQRELKET